MLLQQTKWYKSVDQFENLLFEKGVLSATLPRAHLEFYFLWIHFNIISKQVLRECCVHSPSNLVTTRIGSRLLFIWCWFWKNAECNSCGIMGTSEQIPNEATGDEVVYSNVQNAMGSTWEVSAWSCENEAVSTVQTLVGWYYQGHWTFVMESNRQPAEPSQDNGHMGPNWESHLTQDCQVFWGYSQHVIKCFSCWIECVKIKICPADLSFTLFCHSILDICNLLWNLL